jgi:hypothetical protein
MRHDRRTRESEYGWVCQYQPSSTAGATCGRDARTILREPLDSNTELIPHVYFAHFYPLHNFNPFSEFLNTFRGLLKNTEPP